MTFWVAGGIVAGGIGSALIGSNAAGSAADTQAQSARDATAAQVGEFNTQVGLQDPWWQAGIAGLGKLNDLLGLKPAPSPTMTLTPGPDGVYTPTMSPAAPAGFDEQAYLAANPDVAQYIAAHPPGSVGYTTALQHYQTFGQKEGRSLGTPAAGAPAAPGGPGISVAPGTSQPGTPQTGSLMRTFTNADLLEDPGYQFRLDQGNQALTRAAAAQGGFGSGKYLKDAINFNQGAARQEFGDAYNRFNADQTTQFNRLAAVSGIGQTAANTLSGAAGTLGTQVGSNIIGAGNASAAGQVGQANAFTNAIGQGLSMYQTNSLLNRFPATGYGGGTPPNPYY